MPIETLEQSILFTIAYFDTFDYPPTFFEIWRYLYSFKTSLTAVMDKLDEMIKHGQIEMRNGFYFLPERSDLVEKRERKYAISEKFWKRAVFATKLLSYIPFIKMVSVVNSLTYFNCEKDSDIDLLIVTSKGRIWSVRGLSSVLLHAFGIRRHGKKIAKRICLSYYISEERLNLDYTTPPDLSFLLAFFVVQSAPLINKNQTFEKFRIANTWAYRYFPNAGHNINDYYIDFKKPFLAKQISNLLKRILNSPKIEDIARFIQKRKVDKSQKKWGYPENVRYNDQILKFHPIDYWSKHKEAICSKLSNH